MTDQQMKNLFLRQSYLDAWADFERSLNGENDSKWDYVILTASNEAQAEAYRAQIRDRLDNGLLPAGTVYAVLPDPDGKRVGSGGATLNVLRYLAEQDGQGTGDFEHKRILVIHSGGDSKRVPQYSAIGKLFSPVPRELPNGYGSTLFDEWMIAVSQLPSRIREGMLVLSGDVLLLFDPRQIDFQNRDAAAISVKVPASVGKNHGVFLNDGQGYVEAFLHKQPEERLRQTGAVNDQGNVDLDTGAVILGHRVLDALFSLISTEGCLDHDKFRKFVSEETPLNFYGDFLYPLAKSATLDQYYEEAAEGSFNEKLYSCRRQIWAALSPFYMRLLCLEPAAFLHFGTTKELCKLMAEDIGGYGFLGWSRHVITTGTGDYTANTAYIGRQAAIEPRAYLENCYVLRKSRVEAGAVVSNVVLCNDRVGPNVVLHGLPLRNGGHVVRIYGVTDNPKDHYDSGIAFLGKQLQTFLDNNGLAAGDLWENEAQYLWFAKLYPVCENEYAALQMALTVQRMAEGTATQEEIRRWKNAKRESLYSSFNQAHIPAVCRWQRELERRIRSRRFIDGLEAGAEYEDALQAFGCRGITESEYGALMEAAAEQPMGLRMRIYYALSQYMKRNSVRFSGQDYEVLERMCFETLRKGIFVETEKHMLCRSACRIRRDHVKVELPLRVNWGGGWTDTPPYCIEHGGRVLNGAVKVKGKYPVRVELRRLDAYRVEFESVDGGISGSADTVAEIRNCHDPMDPFSLHKAALIVSGLIPLEADADLQQILKHLGGGISISTQVRGIPKGSGLGTSSILAGACLKGIFEFLGQDHTVSTISSGVLGMEQLMSTGGGWQDQVGGLEKGIKLITTLPGVEQRISVEQLSLSEAARQELQARFALIYTGQRRLARNLLRKVVGSYLSNRRSTVEALEQIGSLAIQMRSRLVQGDIDGFAKLLNQQWALSLRLDPSVTNPGIDRIFQVCEDLIDGKFICGAGGGGFLQVILKKGVTHSQLRWRLTEVFGDSGVDVWETEFVW